MKFLFAKLLTAFLCVNAFAAEDCAPLAAKARDSCAWALQQGQIANRTNSSVGSITDAAAAQVSSLQGQLQYQVNARSFCEKLKQDCERKCAGTGNSAPAPGGLAAAMAGTTRDISSCGDPTKSCDLGGGVTIEPGKCADGSRQIGCSPLVIQIGPEAVEMTTAFDGVNFDIMGGRNEHAPVRIAWLSPRSAAANYFLALPNKSGAVLGIDELFGNNTRGPAGQYGDNGFEALKVYDLNHDGFVDARDRVYADLRLWRDLNVNAQAEHDELFSLKELGVESIDLDYDPNFVEIDRYGNSIRTKSVAKMADGNLRLVYDLWFSSVIIHVGLN